MHVPISIFGVVAFIMVFTYFSVGIVYADDSYIESYKIPTYATDEAIKFDSWLRLHKDALYLYKWGDTDLSTIMDDSRINKRVLDLMVAFGYEIDLDKPILEAFPVQDEPYGWDFYNTDAYTWYKELKNWVVYKPPYNYEVVQDELFNHYNDYLAKYDLYATPEDKEDLKPIQIGWLETVGKFFSALPDGFSNMMNLFTFNIPNMPDAVKSVLVIFLSPMWIILAIGIAPTVAKFLQAIAGLIDSIVPL